jgi:hypothetical protein
MKMGVFSSALRFSVSMISQDLHFYKTFFFFFKKKFVCWLSLIVVESQIIWLYEVVGCFNIFSFLQFPPMDGPCKEEVKGSEVPQVPPRLPLSLDDPPSPVMVKRNRSELANTYEWKNQLSEPGFIAAPVSCFSHVSCISLLYIALVLILYLFVSLMEGFSGIIKLLQSTFDNLLGCVVQ